MPMPGPEIVALIKAGIPDASVKLTDLAGDDNHWAAEVTSASFAGMSRVKQHQAVYKAIGTEMGAALHALQLTTIAANPEGRP